MRLSLPSSMSSTSYLHPLCRSSRSQMFFKIGFPKNFANFTGKYLCFPVRFGKLLRTPFFTEHLRWLLLCMLLFMNVSSFTSPLPHFHYFLTVLLLSSFEEILFLYITITTASWHHRYYHNSRMIHQDCCNR